MGTLLDAYNERLAEVDAYIGFLSVLEAQARLGPPRIEGAGQPISAQQQKILYSSVYLQLYNLVESTMTRCVESISEAAANGNTWMPGDLSESLKKEWVRFVARTHIDLTPDNRLSAAIELCQHLVLGLPVAAFGIDKGGGGNWDDKAIEAISTRIGLQLVVSNDVYSNVKRRVKNDLGPLGLVKSLRNQLAHGSISFEQCAEDVTVQELLDVKEKVTRYIKEVVNGFELYIQHFEFLAPAKRPAVS